jgi:acyl transferase domain-containing protein
VRGLERAGRWLGLQQTERRGCACTAALPDEHWCAPSTYLFPLHLPAITGMLAPDGRSKALDAAADGYVRAEGAAMLLAVNRAAPGAIALVAGSAVNQDGRSSGLTAPNGPAQQEVLRAALASAGLAATDVSGLQLHGTGTGLGDPIEVGAALQVLLSPGGARGAPLQLLAAKSIVGHSEPAAGLTGALYAAHQLAARTAAPVLHLRTLNPHVGAAAEGASAAAASLATAACGEAVAAAVGVSAFAFQVGVDRAASQLGFWGIPGRACWVPPHAHHAAVTPQSSH